MITDAEIESVAISSATPQQAADNLVAEALGAGGHDNVTVLVIDIVNDGREDEHRVLARRMLLRWGIVGVAIMLVVALLSALFVGNSYYIGNTRGNVGIYRGVNANLFGFNLYSLVEETSIDVNELPRATQKHLEEGISMPSLSAAESTIESYRNQIADEKSRASANAQEAQSAGASALTTPATTSQSTTEQRAGE
jgi:protein phosphatase